MAYKGTEAPAQNHEHRHLRNRSQPSVYHHETLCKEEWKKYEPTGAPVYDHTQDSTVYSRLKYDTAPPAVTAHDLTVYSRLKHDTTPPAVTAQDLTVYSRLKLDTAPPNVNPAVDKEYRTHLPPKPKPRSRSASVGITPEQKPQDDAQYDTLTLPATQHPEHLFSQYDITPKKQFPKVQTEPTPPQHVYDTIDDDRSVVSAPVKPVALPRRWMKKSPDQQVLGKKIHKIVESRDSKCIRDNRAQTKGE